MRGYSELCLFEPQQVQWWKRATAMVASLPDEPDMLKYVVSRNDEDLSDDLIRCHELARAVADVLKLDVFDGKCGSVDHSWLAAGGKNWFTKDTILDVYSVVGLPMVQLVNDSWIIDKSEYVPGSPRADIKHAVVERLVDHFKEVDKTWWQTRGVDER